MNLRKKRDEGLRWIGMGRDKFDFDVVLAVGPVITWPTARWLTGSEV